MSFLFGRRSAEPKSDWDVISTVVRAESRLRSAGEILPGRRAGVVFRPGESPFLASLESELPRILNEGEGATKTGSRVQDDEHGTRWVILDDSDFGDLTSSVYTVGNAIAQNGGDNLLIAAVWSVHYSGEAAYWLYTYQRKTFYPFIPRGSEERDLNGELSLSKLMIRHGMVVERDSQHWYPLWGIPF